MRGILVGWCLFGLVDFASGTTIRMASGYAPNRAWASLTGTLAVETANHSFVFWETDGGARWNLTLSATGRVVTAEAGSPPIFGSYQIPGHDLVARWEMLLPGDWYATADVWGGAIESATPMLEALGDDRWRAAIFITGQTAPEPSLLFGFAVLALWLNTRRRGRVFLLILKQFVLRGFGVIVTQMIIGFFGNDATSRRSF